MLSLDALLEAAARPANWGRVVRRCAWCGCVADADGQFAEPSAEPSAAKVVPLPTAVTTDGMCPPCGAKAVALLAARRTRPAQRAA